MPQGVEAFFCTACKRHTTAIKTLRLHRLPRVLLLHIKVRCTWGCEGLGQAGAALDLEPRGLGQPSSCNVHSSALLHMHEDVQSPWCRRICRQRADI